jgi:hypothetical protein
LEPGTVADYVIKYLQQPDELKREMLSEESFSYSDYLPIQIDIPQFTDSPTSVESSPVDDESHAVVA